VAFLAFLVSGQCPNFSKSAPHVKMLKFEWLTILRRDVFPLNFKGLVCGLLLSPHGESLLIGPLVAGLCDPSNNETGSEIHCERMLIEELNYNLLFRAISRSEEACNVRPQ